MELIPVIKPGSSLLPALPESRAKPAPMWLPVGASTQTDRLLTAG
jgi:hypothetical protein